VVHYRRATRRGKSWGADSLRVARDDVGLTGMTRLCLLVIPFARCNALETGMIYSIP
jgi:hypothetical protein